VRLNRGELRHRDLAARSGLQRSEHRSTVRAGSLPLQGLQGGRRRLRSPRPIALAPESRPGRVPWFGGQVAAPRPRYRG